ncbi:MAG: DUF3124 domain-containing protein [Planctomycetota bacterium]
MTTTKGRGPESTGWVLWLADRGWSVVMVVSLCTLLAIAATAAWLDSRLDSIEGMSSRELPTGYQPPDLNARYAEPPSGAASETETTYVPAYSHVYFDGGRPFLLEATLSVRNTSLAEFLYVRHVTYYNTEGEVVAHPVDRWIALKPLETFEYLVPRRDSSGGSGANFLVEWFTPTGGAEPLIEAVMVGNAGSQGLSFRTTGVRITPLDGDAN